MIDPNLTSNPSSQPTYVVNRRVNLTRGGPGFPVFDRPSQLNGILCTPSSIIPKLLECRSMFMNDQNEVLMRLIRLDPSF